MQQTTSREFSIIEPSDPFLPEALNDNTRKIEAALDAHETQTKAVTDALDARITTLEGHKMVCGSYLGNAASTRVIPLPFQPAFVLIHDRPHGYFQMCVRDLPVAHPLIQLIPEGLKLTYYNNPDGSLVNSSGINYMYLALC